VNRHLASAFFLALSFALSLDASTYLVTNVADSGPGSLRAGLEALNSGACAYPCTINFALPPPVPAAGYYTIRPQSPLPEIFGDYVTIDATTQTRLTGDTNPLGPEIELDGTAAGYRSGIKLRRVVHFILRGLAINRFQGHGIYLNNSSAIEVTDCYVGVDPTGTVAQPNGMNGIAVSTTAGVRLQQNIISGNAGNGIYITGFFDFQIHSNRIGVGRNGAPLPNGANGIDIHARDSYITGNIISNNAHYGISVGAGSETVRIFTNEFEHNGLLSLDLGHDGDDAEDALDEDSGPNGRLNAPELLSARAVATLPGFYVGEVQVTGRIRTRPNSSVSINAYAAPRVGPLGFAEAKKYIGRIDTKSDANGVAEFNLTRGYGDTDEVVLIPGGWITATATTSDEGTSEFSLPIPVSANTIEVSTLADSGPGSLRDAITRANGAGCKGDAPCWITFNIPEEQLVRGVAVFVPSSPLPAITSSYVHVDGSSQTFLHGDTNPAGVEVEIRGTNAGATAGLRIGTAETKVAETFIYAIAITAFQGDGVVVEAVHASGYDLYDTRLNRLTVGLDPVTGEARGNGGDGIVVRGTRSGGPQSQWTVRDCTIGANGGHGLRLEAAGATVLTSRIGLWSDATPHGNGGSGVFVAPAAFDVRVVDCVIAFNHESGVATAPEARAVYLASEIYSNGHLGIDRNSDGLGSGPAETVMARPTITSARYDGEKNVTVIEGEMPAITPTLPLNPGSGTAILLRFYDSAVADPSGFGEGEHDGAKGNYNYPLTISGTHFEVRIPTDLRGRFATATASFAICYWEFGCHGRDTSEFSNAVVVE
jgi:hypothetical protein